MPMFLARETRARNLTVCHRHYGSNAKIDFRMGDRHCMDSMNKVVHGL